MFAPGPNPGNPTENPRAHPPFETLRPSPGNPTETHGRTRRDSISVAKREAAAIMDTYVGPKY